MAGSKLICECGWCCGKGDAHCEIKCKGWICTRKQNHKGEHVACAGDESRFHDLIRWG